ncbi:malonic semialdehyde reductase [Streptomyces sp. 3MP-14]|uniref:Malonic semialdehyde reductase n=1 Tax=Streptomyces mimosae TaxID=2586635 RepID=A0A5N6AA84_9ACTN|nr:MULTISPECIES: malonic semialdehyde reductase [Streptomyces]KAB8165172.1 malonic semialdehyde reductase [Streptomyces mimosae]KAB8175804.1 malonic semialdehyde reductase [Streptomyces sp. 3MP-14]
MSFALDSAALDLLFREARTARVFTDEPVSDETVTAVYDLVKMAPTAFNISPLRITELRSREARERLLPLVSKSNRVTISGAPLTVILSYDLDFHEKLPTLMPAVPTLKDTVFADEEVRERQGLVNAALQIGYFVLGVRGAGLAAGPMSGFDATAVDKEFFGDGRQRSMVLVNIGHPGENAYRPRAPRLPAEDAVTVL